MKLTQYELRNHAEFFGESSFVLKRKIEGTSAPIGLYELPRRTGEAHVYRLGHDLAQKIIADAKNRDLKNAHIVFNYDDHEGKVTVLESLIGCSGDLKATFLSVEALDQVEDYIIIAATISDGSIIEPEIAKRILSLPANVVSNIDAISSDNQLVETTELQTQSILKEVSERNTNLFKEEADKLNNWADDQLASVEKSLADTKKKMRDLRNQSSKSLSLDEQAKIQSEIKETERKQRKLRQEIFDIEDRIMAQRDELIDGIKSKLKQKITNNTLFTIKWDLQGTPKS
jgi:adenine-specific DNA-methyltransferase